MADGAGGAAGPAAGTAAGTAKDSSFYEILATMIHCSKEEAITLIKEFNTNFDKENVAFLIPYIEKIPEIEQDFFNEHVKPRRKEEDKLYYKIIRNTSPRALFEAIKEIIIHTYLQSDKTLYQVRKDKVITCGEQYISKLHEVYRYKESFILKMDNLFMTLHDDIKDYLKPKNYNYNIQGKSEYIKVKFTYIFTMLEHYRQLCNLHHQDLHLKNIMMDGYAQFKLIDFGYLTYIEIDGSKIGKIRGHASDILKFIDEFEKIIEDPGLLSDDFKARLGSLKSIASVSDYEISLKEGIRIFSAAKGGKRKNRRVVRKTRKIKFRSF
jgi:hypothetical protein